MVSSSGAIESIAGLGPCAQTIREKLLFVNVFSMFDQNDDNCVPAHVESINYSVVANPYSSMTDEAITQWFSEANRIDSEPRFDRRLDAIAHCLRERRDIVFDNTFKVFDLKEFISRLCHERLSSWILLRASLPFLKELNLHVFRERLQ